MSNYPESVDVFSDKAPNNVVSSSDPNAAYDGIEATQGLVGALGKPQTWSTTLMTILRRYRRDMRIEAAGGVLYARAGEAALENTDGTRWVFRRNASDVTLAAGNLDTGSMVVGTYYVYATGGTAATTSPILFSTDALAPSGIGTAPFRKLGWFYNSVAAALAVTYAGDLKEVGSEINALIAVGVTYLTCQNSSFEDMLNMTLPIVTNGRPLYMSFSAPFYDDNLQNGVLAFNIDGTNYRQTEVDQTASTKVPIAFDYLHQGLVAGTHTVKIQWKRVAGEFLQVGGAVGGTGGQRMLTVIEL
jgi:hypothetical protein